MGVIGGGGGTSRRYFPGMAVFTLMTSCDHIRTDLVTMEQLGGSGDFRFSPGDVQCPLCRSCDTCTVVPAFLRPPFQPEKCGLKIGLKMEGYLY